MKMDIVLPQMGESVTEGTIMKWLKKPGDRVKKDEILYEISTDKVDTEIPSPVAGILTEIIAREGETVEIGATIGSLETDVDDERAAEPESPPPSETPREELAPESVTEKPEPLVTPAPLQPEAPAPSPPEPVKPAVLPAPGTEEGGPRFYSPLVLRIAQEEGISMEALASLKGSGTGGRVTKKDVLSHLSTLKTASAGVPSVAPTASAPVSEPAPAAGPAVPSQAITIKRPEITYSEDGTAVVPMDNIRTRIADHMVLSVKTSPHVTILAEADVTELVKYRNRENHAFKSREGFSLNYTALVTRALALTVPEFPEMNASLDGKNIIYKKHVNIGIAVSLENGLIVPVIKNAEEMTVVGLARAIYDLSTRARAKKLGVDEVQGATISVTNFGSFGSLFGTPIINQPNVAILGIGAIKKRPVVINDAIAIRDIMYLTVTFDHRLIDGAAGGLFLNKVVSYLENVESLVGQ